MKALRILRILGITVCVMAVISFTISQIAGKKIEPWLAGVWAFCCLLFWIQEK